MLNPDFRDMLCAFCDEKIDDLTQPGIVFQIGVAPRRIDILTSIDGVDFETAWPQRQTVESEGLRIPVINRMHLLQNKRATGRPQDRVDVAWLENTETN